MGYRSFFTGIFLALATVLAIVSLQPADHVDETHETPAPAFKGKPGPSTLAEESKPLIAAGETATDSAATTTEAGSRSVPETTGLEVYGRVTDENNQPLEGVLVSDELKFGNVRSGADGRYRISIEWPRFKTPFLNFLRNGYRELRVGVATNNESRQPRYEVNVKLKAATNSTNVAGWIGNDLGEGLGGRKIAIRAKAGQGGGINFYAVISADDGSFFFEGIRSRLNYRLEINPDDEYAGFTLEPYLVTSDTPPLTIVLERLKMVDLEGMVVGTDSAPVGNFSINVENLSLDYPDRRVTSDSSGFFELKNFPAGELKLSTTAPEYFKLTGLNIRENEYRYLVITLDKGNYFLNGWVYDDNGVPLEGARATLQSAFEVDDYHSYAYRTSITDSYGAFQFSGLGGLPQTLGVYARGFNTHLQRHEFSDYSDTVEIRLSR